MFALAVENRGERHGDAVDGAVGVSHGDGGRPLGGGPRLAHCRFPGRLRAYREILRPGAERPSAARHRDRVGLASSRR